ncbi:MAG TPA: type II toxin-antitoxin system VapC family toxin [Pseudonocardiaceae bacterium]|jgi:predicted nucleic acid-binding protein
MSQLTTPVVIDASALLDYVLGERQAAAIEAVLRGPGVRLHAPELVDEELLSAARRLERGRLVPTDRLEQALLDAGSLLIELHPLRPHFDRVWSLRHQITVADSFYVSLAEALDAPLLTTDAKLAAAIVVLPDVRVISPSAGDQD